MQNTLPLLLAGACLAALPLLGPAASSLPSGLTRTQICTASAVAPINFTRDWLGSLHGWHDSPLILAYRGGMAAMKGTPGPATCAY